MGGRGRRKEKGKIEKGQERDTQTKKKEKDL